MKTKPASFAGEGFHSDFPLPVFEEGVESTGRQTKAAAGAFLRINPGFAAALENVPFLNFRPEEKMEVGGVDIDIGQDGVPG
jgi:hypothetical protein